MTQPTVGPDEPERPSAPPATTVVGYPGLASSSPTVTTNPGTDYLVRQVRTMRLLVVGCFIVIVALAAALGFVAVNTQSQLDAMSAQITGVGEQFAAAAAAQAPAATSGGATASAAAVAQLTAATPLTGVTTLPTGVDEAGAVLIGDPQAKDVVEVFIDYQCPYCQRWEQTVGTALIDKAMKPGSGLLVKQYNLAFLGETNLDLSPAGASARAASAAACVVNADGADVFVAFSRAVFAAADPTEPPGQFTAADLVDLATKAGASPAAITCIQNEEHVDFVSATTKAGFTRGVGGTPTVVVNGKTVGNPFTDPTVTALVSSST